MILNRMRFDFFVHHSLLGGVEGDFEPRKLLGSARGLLTLVHGPIGIAWP